MPYQLSSHLKALDVFFFGLNQDWMIIVATFGSVCVPVMVKLSPEIENANVLQLLVIEFRSLLTVYEELHC